MELVLLLLFGSVSVFQLFSLIVKVLRVRSYDPEVSSQRPKITVIVAAHNDINNLKVLIPALRKQDYEDFEIVVALDRCNDSSLEYLEELNCSNLRILNITECPGDWNSKKYALHSAISESTTEWLVFTDADCSPGPHWLSCLATQMSESRDIILGLSPYQRRSSLLNQVIQLETFTTALEFSSQAMVGQAYMGLGRNLAYRKSSFINSGGFDRIKGVQGGDDDLMVQQIAKGKNCAVILEPKSHVESIPKTNWKAFLAQKTRHYSVGKFYPTDVKLRETFRWLINILFWLLFFFSVAVSPVSALIILATSFLMRIISINIVARRMGKRFNHLWLPFVDLVCTVILPLISLRSLMIKNIKWN